MKLGLKHLYDTCVTTTFDHSFESKSVNVSSMTSVSKRKVGFSLKSTLASMYMEFGQYLQQPSLLSLEKIDLDIYLEEPTTLEDDFDILKWWKVNSAKYPILLRMGCDVLLIPVSTVVSKLGFSVGSMVLNKYRSSLDATTIQALMCTKNWLQDDISTVDILEEDVLSLMRMKMCLKFLMMKHPPFPQLLIGLLLLILLTCDIGEGLGPEQCIFILHRNSPINQ